GKMPFMGTPVETVRQVLRGDQAPPAGELRPEIDAQLTAICMKAMAHAIDDRYRTMADLAEALLEFLRGRSQKFQVSAGPRASEPAGAAVLSRRGAQLFRMGRWSVAHDVISTAASLPGLEGGAAVRQRNRLVHLCKNMDRWAEALEHSEWCVARLGAQPTADL